MLSRSSSSCLRNFFVLSIAAAGVLQCHVLPTASAGSVNVGDAVERNLQWGGITMGSSTLDDVRGLFGPAPQARDSNFEGSPISICYGGPGATLRASSGAAGGWKTVNVLRIQVAGPDGVSCAPGSIAVAGLSTRDGLRLGLSKRQVLRVLGPPDTRQLRKFIYKRVARRQLSGGASGRAVDIVSSIEIEFVRDVVTSIELAHSETT